MGESIKTQIYIFFTTIYGGIIIGFLYDLYRIFRYYSKPKKIATFIEDLIFWIIVSLIALFILLFSNWGEIRGYVFLGFISGAIIYHKLLSKTVITILVHVTNFIVRWLKKVFSLIFYPFRLIGELLHQPYKKLCRKVKRLKKIFLIPKRVIKDSIKYLKLILRKK